MSVAETFWAADAWLQPHAGPRYAQLARHVSGAIRAGALPAGAQLPPEREIARLSGLSRVTIRKSMAVLTGDGLVEQRQGAGSFVSDGTRTIRVEQSLSALTSFTAYMEQRGMVASSRVLDCGVVAPTPEETVALGLGAGERVARLKRLRSADGAPLAIEISSLPVDILPDPAQVARSLYALLSDRGCAPTRAVQRIQATNLGRAEADLLDLPQGTAVLGIDRTGYRDSGRPIEITRGLYRSDIYNFVAELRLTPAA
ncbi:MAG: GntR family transcriptional regulator [Pseudomonadota bacterium]